MDGTYVYGIGETPANAVPSSYIPYNAPMQHVLVKSVANPTSYQNAGWSFLASVPANNSVYFSSSTPGPGYQCKVDSRGVFTLSATTSAPAGSTATTTHIRGLQWDPLGTNTIANATGSGGWTVLDSSNSIVLEWTSTATLAIFGYTPTLLYLDSDRFLDFATLDPVSKTFNTQSTSWDLLMLGASGPEMLEYGNNKLYMLSTTGVISPLNITDITMSLITAPLIAVGPAPANSALTVSDYKLGPTDCKPVTVGTIMNLIGNEVFILCTNNDFSSTIYHHDGVHWAAPILMPDAGMLSSGLGLFVRSPDGTTWVYVQDWGTPYTISNGSATWMPVGGVNITENFGTAPSPTETPSPAPTNANGSGGIGTGAIAGIIVGVIVVLAGAFFIFRRGKNKSPGGVQAPTDTSKESKTASAFPDGKQQYTGYPAAQPYSQYSVALPGTASHSDMPQIPPHFSIPPQISPNLSVAPQGTPVSGSTANNSPHQTNLSDIQFSVHPRPNIVQGAAVESATFSTTSSMPDQATATTTSVAPVLATHSRPNISLNNPQYHAV
ncbi:hypothetical protein BGX26_011146 [Mortierella sp. AD094]|nr:hypothetical protein BGX26_011146 [Mortierella sp. AD094]